MSLLAPHTKRLSGSVNTQFTYVAGSLGLDLDGRNDGGVAWGDFNIAKTERTLFGADFNNERFPDCALDRVKLNPFGERITKIMDGMDHKRNRGLDFCMEKQYYGIETFENPTNAIQNLEHNTPNPCSQFYPQTTAPGNYMAHPDLDHDGKAECLTGEKNGKHGGIHPGTSRGGRGRT